MVHYLVFPSVLVLLMESPLRRNTHQGPAIVGIDRSKCLRLYPVVAAVKQGGAGARIVAGTGAGQRNHGVQYLESTNRTSQYDETAYISTNLVGLLKFCKDMDNDTHLGAPALEGCKLTRRVSP